LSAVIRRVLLESWEPEGTRAADDISSAAADRRSAKIVFHARENAQDRRTMQKTTITVVRAHLIECRRKRLKWREIGELYPGVKMGTLCRIAKDADYDPKDNAIRHALGLQEHTVEVYPLPCGCAPSGKRCKLHDAKKPRRTYDISYKRLRALLNNPYYKDS
jgi:hypothetical protein